MTIGKMNVKVNGGGGTRKVKAILLVFLSVFLVAFGGIFLTACGEANEYSILLLDEDENTVLYVAKIEEGEPITGVTTPTKASDAEYTYTFAGWVDANGTKIVLSFATSNITAYATYTATAREYSLTIKANGAEVSSYEMVEIISGNKYLTTGATLHYGDKLQIEVNGSEGYSISGNINYSGLDKVSEDGTIYYVVTGDVTISFSEIANTYTVKFLDATGTQLYATTASYGTSVDYPYETPTKAADLTGTYVFAGWVDTNGDYVDLSRITGNTTVYASYTITYIEYLLSIQTGANIVVYKNGTAVSSGSVVYYGDVLTIEATPSEGHKVSSLQANGTEITNGVWTVSADTEITYSEEICTYTVSFYDESGLNLLSSQVVDWNTTATATGTPTKDADDRYTYTFAGWKNDSGTIVSTTLQITNVKEDMTLYATFTEVLIPYSITVSDGIEVLLADGTTTVTNVNMDDVEIYYGDTFTVSSYTVPDGYSYNSIVYENATLTKGVYTICGNVTLTLYFQKSYVAEEYSGVQTFDAFVNGSGETVIDSGDCKYKDGFVFGTYVGSSEVELTATYKNYIAMKSVTYEVTGTLNGETYTYNSAHVVNYTDSTYTWNGYVSGDQEEYLYTAYITTALYKGMTIEFELTYDSNAITLGLMSATELDNPTSYLWKTSYTGYSTTTFCPTYNIFSNKAQTYLSTIVANTGKITAISDTAPSFYKSSSNYDSTVTVRFILGDYVTVIVSDSSVEYTLEMTDWEISSSTTAYYFSVMGNSGATIKFTEFGYYEHTASYETAYVATLKGQTITTFGDSITNGSGATDADGNADKSYSYSKLLTAALGMTENNQGISGAVYCSDSPNNLTCQTSNISTIPEDSRIVIVYLGVNDFKKATSTWATLSGSFDASNTDTTTIWGALNVAYSTLYSMFHGTSTDVYICTPSPTEAVASDPTTTNSAGWTMAQLADAVKTVAAYYGFTVIDVYNGIDWESHSDSSEESWFYDDMGHPNSLGHAQIADYIYEAIIEASLDDYILSCYED